jgi:hypothetical protein
MLPPPSLCLRSNMSTFATTYRSPWTTTTPPSPPPDCLLRHHVLQVRTARPCQRLRRCAEHVAQCPVVATDRPVPLFLRPFGAPFAACSSTTQINALSMLSRNSTVLSGSSTPGTVGHRLRHKILDTASFLQWQTAGEPYTPYRIRPYHSRLNRRGYQSKKNKSR